MTSELNVCFWRIRFTGLLTETGDLGKEKKAVTHFLKLNYQLEDGSQKLSSASIQTQNQVNSKTLLTQGQPKKVREYQSALWVTALGDSIKSQEKSCI